jgi:CRP-like cAMP-binding protein
MNQLKVYKKGEFLLKEGDRLNHLILISTGLVAICVVRGKKNVELYRAGNGQVIGEEILNSAGPTTYAVVALNETKILEAPVEIMQQQLAASGNVLKLFIKGLIEKQKTVSADLKSLKLESSSAPCPSEHVAKIFGVIFHTANTVGKKADGKTTVPWAPFRKYAQRVFLEPPTRLEQAMYLLMKLKLVEKQMVKSETDPTAPEELGFFHILDIGVVEKFFDFYQNYYFKPGFENLLKYDEKCMQTAQAMLKVSEGEKVDRNGNVTLNFKDSMDKLKTELGSAFHIDALDRLQQKGLFVKRQSNNSGGTIAFLKPDFELMIQNWKILKEIEKWNELGFVDLSEPKEKKAVPGQAEGDALCPACNKPVSLSQKFCGECGSKLAVAA